MTVILRRLLATTPATLITNEFNCMLPHINLRLADQQHSRGLCSSILSAALLLNGYINNTPEVNSTADKF